MKSKNTLVRAGFAALCAVGASVALSSAATAGSVTYPGELVGYSFAPLPEGVFAANTSAFGNDRGLGDKSSIYVDIPVIVWSTPWNFLGGHIEAYVAGPFVGVYAPVGSPGAPGGLYTTDFYNPFVTVGESWDLGQIGLKGFYVANFVGTYLPIDNALGQNYFTLNDRLAIGYVADGWDITAHTTFGFRMNTISGPLAGYQQGNYINEDLTATKKLGKWEIGPVAFGSWDIGGNNVPVALGNTGLQQGQFAIGGLVGYDFGGLYGQVYVTHDVWVHNYTPVGTADVYETNIFGRIIVPLWTPPKPAPALVSKY